MSLRQRQLAGINEAIKGNANATDVDVVNIGEWLDKNGFFVKIVTSPTGDLESTVLTATKDISAKMTEVSVSSVFDMTTSQRKGKIIIDINGKRADSVHSDDEAIELLTDAFYDYEGPFKSLSADCIHYANHLGLETKVKSVIIRLDNEITKNFRNKRAISDNIRILHDLRKLLKDLSEYL